MKYKVHRFNIRIKNVQINTAGLSDGLYFIQMRDAYSIIGVEKVILN